jgi:hypothetical protein
MIWPDERTDGDCWLLESPRLVRSSSGFELFVDPRIVRELPASTPGWTAPPVGEELNGACPHKATDGRKARVNMDAANTLSRSIRTQSAATCGRSFRTILTSHENLKDCGIVFLFASHPNHPQTSGCHTLVSELSFSCWIGNIRCALRFRFRVAGQMLIATAYLPTHSSEGCT